ncbi:MAG TPA: polysaccharide deacetylase family protein [Allosphingosinicella sp.]|nr:polysaccharide deacetylase family protein [Allosphingosinicella sp.]
MIGLTPFLFSVDVEDPRMSIEGGEPSTLRVPRLIETYLHFLEVRKAQATFFVVGEVARRFPEMVNRIAAAGHEIACHSDRHIVLADLGPAAFREDLLRNIEAIEAAGVDRPVGYRAPCFSLTKSTCWAYPILAELGFSYSSSVVPAFNPLHGWAGFGPDPRSIGSVLELPVSLHSSWLPVPLGGVYLRVLPMPLVLAAIRRRTRRGQPLLSYTHPYDIDPEEEGYAHPGFSRWSPYNWLMRLNRRNMMARLEAVSKLGLSFQGYGAYAASVRREIDFGG